LHLKLPRHRLRRQLRHRRRNRHLSLRPSPDSAADAVSNWKTMPNSAPIAVKKPPSERDKKTKADLPGSAFLAT